MAIIDIGDDPIFRTAPGVATYTYVSKGNPANASGKITEIKIYLDASATDVEVAIFSLVPGTTLTTRSVVAIGAVTGGSVQTFPVDLDVETGDLIGLYGGTILRGTGGSGLLYLSGDWIPCTDKSFSLLSGYAMSLYGTGETLSIGNKIIFGCNF